MKDFFNSWAGIYVVFAVFCIGMATVLTYKYQPAKPKQECPVAAYVHGGTGCKISPGEK